MPVYGAPQGPKLISPGHLRYFFGGINPPPYGTGLTETTEALVQGTKSVCLVTPAVVGGNPTAQRQLSWSTEFPSAPVSVKMDLQAAMRDVEAEYVTIDSSTNVGGEVRTIQSNLIFFRLVATTVSGGTNPSVIAKARCL